MLKARFRFIFLVPALLLAGACGSSSGPHNGGNSGTVSVNSVVEGTVSGGATNQYDVKFSLSVEFTVLFQVLSGSVTLDLVSSSGTHLATVLQGQPDQALGSNGSDTFTSSAGSVYHINVHGDGQYRFEVYSSLPSPEHTGAAIAIGDTVSEQLEAGTDVDDFHFTGTAGDTLIAYLQAIGAPGAGVAQLVVSGPGGPGSISVQVRSSAGRVGFEQDATDPFTLVAGGTYTVRVTAVKAQSGAFNAFAGPYKFQIRRIQHEPEHVAATVAPGNTVTGESIDYVGDIDRFTISGAPGQELNVLFQTTTHDTATLALNVTDFGATDGFGDPLRLAVSSRGTDRALTDNSTSRFTLPASGHATIEVSGLPLARGAYAFRVSPVNRAPETAPPALVIGDSITTERLDAPGDIDEFTLTVPAGDTLNLGLELDPAALSAPTDSILFPVVEVFTLTGDPAGAVGGQAGPPPISYSGTHPMAPGQYLLRVSDPSIGRPLYRSYFGAYRVRLTRIRSAPESAPGVIAIGDVVQDALIPSGDVDAFTFAGHVGDVIDIQLQGLGAPGGQFYYQLVAPGLLEALFFGQAPTSSPSLGAAHSGTIILPMTASWQVIITSSGNGANPVEAAPYRLAIVRVPTAPEVHAATLAIGELMTNEALDSPDDVDIFTVHATPGTEVVVVARTNGPNVLAEAVVPTTLDTIRTSPLSGARGTTGRFPIPASGDLLVRISSPTHDTGPYTLQVLPINRAPEVASATYALGDTVGTESIDLFGADVDEFHFSGTAGEKIAGYFQTPLGVAGLPGLILEVVSSATQHVLGSVTSLDPTPNLKDQSTGTITLPVAGQYLVRVRSGFDRATTGGYRFSVQNVP